MKDRIPFHLRTAGESSGARIVSGPIVFALCAVLVLSFFLGNITGASASENPTIFSSVDEYLERESKEAHLPGMAVVIVDKDNVLLSGTYGDCDSTDTPFFIGSNSKSFTAAAIMQLVEQGRIDLDEHISTYIPGIRDGDKITVRQLLNHTSGIRTYDTYENYSVSSGQGSWMYANVNYGILGLIIEAVSGTSYTDYVKEHFFEPLGMEHTYTSLAEAKKNGLIPGNRNYFGFMIKKEMPYPEQKVSGWLSIPAGYIISSASDMGRYLQFYLNNGEGLLASESIQTMFYDSVRINEEASYGFGWSTLESLDEPVLYHNGLVENYISYMFILPESGIGGVILTNCNDYLVANDLVASIFQGVLALLLGEEPGHIGAFQYETKHLVLDAICLAITVLCVLPLLLIRRWKKRYTGGGQKVKAVIGFVFLHVLVPTLLLLFPATAGVPLPVVKRFVPDIYIILFVNAIIACCTSIIKVIGMITARLNQAGQA